MRRKFKRLTAFLLSAAMVFPFFGEYPSGTFDIDWGFDWSVSAEEETPTSGTCGAEGNESSVTWFLDSDGTLTISGSGAMWDYYTGDKRAPWNVHKDNITTVIIEEGVTTIGTYAFWMCAQLTEITISATVTTIGDRAFFNCERLIQITIPQSVTSIGEGVFAGCSSITSVTLPNSISTIQEDTFLGCKSLTSLTIPKGVTTIGPGAFYNCTSLNSITIPEGVTTIGNFAFSGCTSLETIVIPSSVTTIGAGAFDEVPGVSSEDGFLIINGILMKYTGDAENVEIPSGVTSINDNAFAHNYSIVSVKIPSGVTKLGIQAFGRCDSLVSVELPETLISMDNSFIYCGKLEEITIPSGMKTIGRYAFYDCTSLAKVTIPNSVTEIGDEAFDNIAANATINAPCSWNENPLYSFATGITVNIPAHQNLTYSVNDEGNVINNECSNCGKVGGTLTINAEGGIYDGKTAYGATVERTGTLENEEVTVNYYQGDTLIGTDAPINAGTYTAKITYGDVTASVTFTITRAFEVTGGTEGVDYTYENGVLTINTSTALTIKNTDPSTPTTDRIEVATGISANITLAGVNIDVSATENTAAFKIADNSTGNVTITLADGTTNTLKSGKYCAGLQKNGGTSTGMLTIQGETAGTGVLNAIGADYGAGIGGDENSSGCNITISGGIVTAQCDDEVGAGIGGGEWGSGRNITISGGTVTVQGGSYSAGIGGGILGYGSNIEISGGSVKVVAGYGAPAIGDGQAYGGAVTPTDGTNDVYLLELTVDGTSAVTINGSTNYPKKHFEENKLYVYLPAKTAQAPNEVTIGSTTTKYTYDTTNSKWLTVVDAPEADINKFTCNGVELTYTLAESDYYTISGNKQTNAGTYTVTVSLKENTVWSDGTTDDKEYPFTITYTDADNDGICDDCGSYDEPERVDEYYQIANAGNLMCFAQKVNEGQTAINAKLTADIAMNGIDWTIMSSFAGTFDGNGHTISGLNGHKPDTADTHCFIKTLADGGVVKNLTFTEADIWNHEGPGAISAVIVYTNYGTVENCVVKSSLIQHGNYDALGVVVGVNDGTICNCASISNTMVRRFSSAKAICGFVWANSGSIENCFNYDCTYQNGSNRYAFTQSNTGTITNCYYYESSETISDTVAAAKTAEAFASGEVAYLLNGSSSENVTWYQKLLTDTYPVLDSKHGTVYSVFACDGTTPAGYSNKNKNEPHIDENGDEYCDNCGVIYNGIGAHLAGYSVSLNGSIGVNFHMDLTQDVLNDNEAYMLFTLPNGTTQKVMVSDAKAKESTVIEGKTYYIFTCNVAAKEMTDTIQAQLITSDGSKTQVYEYSVREYADRILSGNYDAETQELVKAMLHYGAYSQEWFDYNTTNLANAGLETLDLSEANDWDGFDPIISNNDKVGSFTSAYLTLESDTAINLKFKLADGVSFEDLRVVVEDPLANVVPVTTDTTENVCLITLTGIKASDLDTTYDFSVTDGEGNESYISYSAMSYACAVANSEMDQKLKNVTAALRIFNLRANEKFEY